MKKQSNHESAKKVDGKSQKNFETSLNQRMSSGLQMGGGVAEWRDIMSLSSISIQTLQLNSVLQLKILPCLINGIHCGTVFFKAAIWKLNWLKDSVS